MLVSNVIVAASVMLWAGASASPIVMADRRSFVFRVMQDDDTWKPHLRVGIKINTNAVQSNTVSGILLELSSGRQGSTAWSDGIVNITTALAVVANVVTRHFAENEALDFALSVIASAIRCRTLSNIAIQLRAIIATPEADREQLIACIRHTLIAYADKLARLNEPLNVESEIFYGWEAAIRYATNDTTTPVQRLVDEALLSRCEINDDVTKTSLRSIAVKNVESLSDPKETFYKLQNELTEMFNDIPVHTMDYGLRDGYYLGRK